MAEFDAAMKSPRMGAVGSVVVFGVIAVPVPRFGLLLPAPQIVAASPRSIPLPVLRCLHVVGCGDAVGQAGYLVGGNDD
jgi:hypothetical protein